MEEKKQVEVYIEVKKMLALLDALAELIRFNREQGYPEIASWYKTYSTTCFRRLKSLLAVI